MRAKWLPVYNNRPPPVLQCFTKPYFHGMQDPVRDGARLAGQDRTENNNDHWLWNEMKTSTNESKRLLLSFEALTGSCAVTKNDIDLYFKVGKKYNPKTFS
jgi:hypothetical protein